MARCTEALKLTANGLWYTFQNKLSRWTHKNACYFNVLWPDNPNVFFDNDHQHKPHIHVEYQGHKAVVEITSGLVIAGTLPPKQTKLVSAWVEIHEDELLADWQLAVNGEPVFKIEPLR
ncbi:MAG: hypothetical protein RL497_2198 [Pseudomonadota bacterium]|jgi:hypothetical protein